MNRNVESHFSELPKVEIERSMFDRSSSHKTSFNVGQLIPFYCDEVLPGDTFNITTSAVVRLQTPLTPIMDNIYMDTYFFFVPNRLVWSHWKEFMGENNESAWIPSTEYSIPYIKVPSGGFNVGTIADYFGIPVGVNYSEIQIDPADYKQINSLPFRGYALIADTWFRDQNLEDPVVISTSDSAIQGTNVGNNKDVMQGGNPFKVAKYHDYFTSCLPGPQKSTNVDIFNGTTNNGFVPVIPKSNKFVPDGVGGTMMMREVGNTVSYGLRRDTDTNKSVVTAGTGLNFLQPSNLWADLTAAGTINDLRLAFQVQKYFEKNARAGTRYREIIKEHFGITSSDARMMIPEYLGGHRFPLNIHQVANQAQGESDFLGDLGAMSNTADIHEDFTKSFEEHGFVIGVCCVRYDHSYPQGLERMWMRKTKFDYYYPVFANIGEQPVFKHEICLATGNTGFEVFGYQEAWAEYRYKPNRVSGEMRPGVANSLATWHLADYYNTTPSLSASWIREDKSNVDRVLSVSSDVANQVFCDFYIKNIATRPMPVYSIPGLIDHH